MWHEARRQEKSIRSMMVNYQKRAERRRDYYQRIRQDPIKFLRIFGQRCKIHVDADVAAAGENPKNMMPWCGDRTVLIDRFDARANLDMYQDSVVVEEEPSKEEKIQERLCNYERFRCLVQNEFANVTEEQCLRQIDLEEKYGSEEEKRKKEEADVLKKKLQETRVAIGFNYSDQDNANDEETVKSLMLPKSSQQPSAAAASSSSKGAGNAAVSSSLSSSNAANNKAHESDEESLADSDMDIDVEIDVTVITTEQKRQLVRISQQYGMRSSDFVKLLNNDKQLEDELRAIKAIEEAKSKISGKKGRKERRMFKEQRLRERNRHNPNMYTGSRFGSFERDPSKLLCSSPSSQSSHKSDSSDEGGESRINKVEYITTFGDVAEASAAATKSQKSSSSSKAMMSGARKAHPSVPTASPASRSRMDGNKKATFGPTLPNSHHSQTHRRPSPKYSSHSNRLSAASRRSPRRRSRSRSPTYKKKRRSLSRSFSSSPSSRSSYYRRKRRRSAVSSSSPSSSSSSSSFSRISRSKSFTKSQASASSGSRHSSPKNVTSKVGMETDEAVAGAVGNHNNVVTAAATCSIRKRYYRPELEEAEDPLSDHEADHFRNQHSSSHLGSSSFNGSLGKQNHPPAPKIGLTPNSKGFASNKITSSAAVGTATTSSSNNNNNIVKLSPAEILRRKMQMTLSKTYNEDKKAEMEKQQKMELEKMQREEQLRQMSLEMRRREKERRRSQGTSDAEEENRRRRRRSSSNSRSGERSNSQSSRRRQYRSQHHRRARPSVRHSRSSSPSGPPRRANWRDRSSPSSPADAPRAYKRRLSPERGRKRSPPSSYSKSPRREREHHSGSHYRNRSKRDSSSSSGRRRRYH